MKIERKKNASRNIVFGSVLKLYQIIGPFIIRTAMIRFLGIEYLGLNSLFTSILQVLNLAELGVGSALVFSMYKPIAEDDGEKIRALMRLYKIYYRIIGIVVLALGLILLPFIPNLISQGVPKNINVYVLYVLNLLATVVSYWLFAYQNCLLTAHQRTDITSKVNIFMISIQYVLQIVILWRMKNYYLYVIVTILIQAATNIVIACVVSKQYPQYKAEGELDKKLVKDINSKVKDLFTSKLGSVILNSADSIVISAFLGLTPLAVYNNYYYIITALNGFILTFFNSCTAGIGNSLLIESMDKNYGDFKKITFLTCAILNFCVCCLVSLFQPFMEIWVGSEYLLQFGLVVCFCVYFYIVAVNNLMNIYKDAAGAWHEDRFRPLAVAIVNLVINLILVRFLGLYGVLLSTILSLVCVSYPWLLHNLFSVVFKNSASDYVRLLAKCIISTICIAIFASFVCSKVTAGGIIGLFVILIICTIISNGLFVLLFLRSKVFQDVVEMLRSMLDGGFNKLLKRH